MDRSRDKKDWIREKEEFSLLFLFFAYQKASNSYICDNNFLINKILSKTEKFMANYSNSIDMTIFMSIKVSEISAKVLKSPIQTLLLSGPGMGKSTAVQLYAEINGYELVMLRGNSSDPETIQGFDVAPTDTTKEHSTKHLRPTWFQTVLDNEAAGKKTLLFLDEISTANEYVQSALLQLILERKCNAEYLPKDVLIVSAANYSNNLSNTMIMLPPLLNRFMIVNIIPTTKDIAHFLSKYEGSMSGKRVDFKGDLKAQMKQFNELFMDISDESKLDKVCELFEKSILDEAVALGNEKILDLGVSDLKDLYGDVEGKDPLPGFITMRTLCFFRDIAISTYLAFGKEGLSSDNFKNMALGLVGMALSYDKGEVKKTFVFDRFCKAVLEAANDAAKMMNSKIPEYNELFEAVLKEELTLANCHLLANKISELLADKQLSKIDRPLDPVYVVSIADKVRGMIKKAVSEDRIDLNSISAIASGGSIDISTPIIDPKVFAGRVNDWNGICTLMDVVYSTVQDQKKHYGQKTKEVMQDTKIKCREYYARLKTLRKSLAKDTAIAEMIPQFKMF